MHTAEDKVVVQGRARQHPPAQQPETRHLGDHAQCFGNEDSPDDNQQQFLPADEGPQPDKPP